MLINTGARAVDPKKDQPPVAISQMPAIQVPKEKPSAAPVILDSPISLHVFPNVIQGSDEWHDQRRGLATASVVGLLITTKTLKAAANETSRGLAAKLAAERITGYTEPSATSRDMERGTLDEPYARELYAETYAPVEQVGFMVRDDFGFKIGYSPDGLVGEDGLIEIKSRAQKKHLQTVLEDAVPAENMAQIQCGLLVSGRKWCDYVSYCGGMALWTKRVFPDPAWQSAIVAAISAFEALATDMISTYLAKTDGAPIAERIDHFGDEEIQ